MALVNYCRTYGQTFRLRTLQLPTSPGWLVLAALDGRDVLAVVHDTRREAEKLARRKCYDMARALA